MNRFEALVKIVESVPTAKRPWIAGMAVIMVGLPGLITTGVAITAYFR